MGGLDHAYIWMRETHADGGGVPFENVERLDALFSLGVCVDVPGVRVNSCTMRP
jgi:hypothetical protein